MTVVHGDCYEEMERLISENIKMDLIILDPPYEVQSNGGWTVNTIKKLNKSLNNGIVKDNLVKWYDYQRAFDLLDKLQDNINIYFFCSKKQIMTYMNRYVNEKKCTFDIIMWHKKNALPTYFNKYLTDCEYILHFRKWAKCKPESYEDAKTVFLWEINHKDKKLYWHPSIKPLPLLEKIIRNSSSPWDTVFDCFAWSGTTWVAAKNTGRNYYLVENELKNINLIHQRLWI